MIIRVLSADCSHGIVGWSISITAAKSFDSKQPKYRRLFVFCPHNNGIHTEASNIVAGEWLIVVAAKPVKRFKLVDHSHVVGPCVTIPQEEEGTLWSAECPYTRYRYDCRSIPRMWEGKAYCSSSLHVNCVSPV